MDTPLKELARLEKLQAFSSPRSTPSKTVPKESPSVSETVDSLLSSLQELKQRVEAGTTSEEVVHDVVRLVEEKKKELDERQKEIHGSLGKLGKAIDKVSAIPLHYPAHQLIRAEIHQSIAALFLNFHFSSICVSP